MNGKRKILVLADWYVPGYKAGGPIRSVSNIVNTFKEEFDFSLVTRDTDYLEDKPYPGIKSNEWVWIDDRVRVWYFSKDKLNRATLTELLSEGQYDVIYFNSFFSYYFSLLPLYLLTRKIRSKARIILAPRGMLAANALNIKRTKKKAFIAAAKFIGLHKGITWHASSQLEEQEIKDIFPRAEVKIALNLPSPVQPSWQQRTKIPGSVRLFFLSRIAIKKNLHAGILALAQVRNDVQFDIYGPVDEQAYWDKCRDLIRKLPSNIKVDYKGAIGNEQVHATIQGYHFMLFPTLNENFGHVILESLAAGCPVIISDQTPWKELETKKAGWDIPLDDPSAFTSVIEKCAAMDQQEYNEWSQHAYRHAATFLHDPASVEANRKLFS